MTEAEAGVTKDNNHGSSDSRVYSDGHGSSNMHSGQSHPESRATFNISNLKNPCLDSGPPALVLNSRSGSFLIFLVPVLELSAQCEGRPGFWKVQGVALDPGREKISPDAEGQISHAAMCQTFELKSPKESDSEPPPHPLPPVAEVGVAA